jgi:hypothetical protein
VPTLGEDHAALLSRLELFSGLDRIHAGQVGGASRVANRLCGRGGVSAGDVADGLYLLSHGTFGIYAEPGALAAMSNEALYSGTGARMFGHAQARPVAIACALLTVVGLLVSVPYWHWLGLL